MPEMLLDMVEPGEFPVKVAVPKAMCVTEVFFLYFQRCEARELLIAKHTGDGDSVIAWGRALRPVKRHVMVDEGCAGSDSLDAYKNKSRASNGTALLRDESCRCSRWPRQMLVKSDIFSEQDHTI